MNAPPPILEEGNGETRYWGGWILLALLLGLIATSELNNALHPHPSKGSKIASARTSLKANFLTEDKVDGDFIKSLDEAIKPVGPLRTKDKEAAKIFAVMESELHRTVTPFDVDLLTKSNKPSDRAFAKIYTSPKLTKPEAQDLAKQIQSPDLVDRLAGIQALEKAGDTSARSNYRKDALKGNVVGIVIGILLVGLSFVLWFTYVTLRLAGKLQPLGIPLQSITCTDADRLARRAGGLFGTFLVLSEIIGLLARGTGASWLTSLVGACMIVAVFVSARIPMWGKTISAEALGIRRDKLGIHALWGLGAAIANIPFLFILLIIGTTLFRHLPPPEHPATVELQNTKDLVTILSIIFFGSVAAPIWEETMFRGLLFPALGRFVGLIPAAAISGLCFATIHPTGPAVWLSLAGVGVMSCALTYQTRSLMPSIFMHAIHNLTLLLMTVYLS